MAFNDLKRFKDLIQECGIRVASKDTNLTAFANELRSKKTPTPFISGDIILKSKGGALITEVLISIPMVYDTEEYTKDELIELKTRELFSELSKRFPIVWAGVSAWKENLTAEVSSKMGLTNVITPAYMINVTLGREYGHCPMKFE